MKRYNPLGAKPFVLKKKKNPRITPMPSYVSIQPNQPEALTGQVQNQTASAPEERLARAFDKAHVGYQFQYIVGAPKGMPGWKSLDFLASINGMLYAIEVDTAFTHRLKAQTDVLHDAIILNDQNLQQQGEVYPHVFHASGDHELAAQDTADQYVRQTFGV